MALVCPACGTENRAVARFCIECIGVLQPDFEPTQVASRRTTSECTTLMGMPTALAEFGSAAPPASPLPAPPPGGPRRTGSAEPRKGLWLSVAAFAITLIVGAGGWMIAGAGGWYIYSAGAAAEVPPAVPTLPPLPAVALAPPLPAVSLVTMVAPPAVPEAATPVATPTPPPAARAVPLAKARPATPVSAPRPLAGSDPEAACADRGFLARSRCMAAQCAKSENRGQSACQAVVAQQRLMEEKRNPTLAN